MNKLNRFKFGVLILSLLIAMMGVSTFAFSQNTNLVVSYLDVGQADSIVIQLPNHKNVLIDGGNRGDAKFIKAYLLKSGIKKIDVLIATHPHEDHIGGLPQIIKSVEVEQVYMPKVTSNTKIFESFLLGLKEKKIKVRAPKIGEFIINEEDLKLQVLSPKMEKYEETNDYSLVLKLTYKNRSFLFTGDASAYVEKEMLSGNVSLKSDVLKVAHHGSKTSTSNPFLEALNPSIAVISCGKNNDYGHPHKATLKRFQGIKVYRTDQLGSVVVTTNGKTLSVMMIK